MKNNATADFDLVDSVFVGLAKRDRTSLSPNELVVLLVWHTTGIIENGGFRYFHEQRMSSKDASEAMQKMALPEAGELISVAVSLFPSSIPVADDELARELMKLKPQLDELDRKFWTLDNLITKKLATFIRKHGLQQ